MASARCIRAIVAVTVIVLCACGDDATRPHINTLAAHYDSLAQAALASGDLARGVALLQVAIAYKAGITPVTVIVDDSGTATTYRAAVVRSLLPHSPPFPGADSARDLWDLVLWQDPDGSRFIHVGGSADSVDFAPSDNSFFLYALIEWGDHGRNKAGIEGHAVLVTSDSSGSCAFASASLRCTRASFTVSFDAVLKPLLGSSLLVDDSGAPHPISATALVVPGIIIGQR